MTFKSFAILFLMLLFSGAAIAGTDIRLMARQAISPDPDESAIAINHLRAMKQEGLSALTREFSEQIQNYRDSGNKTDLWRRIANAIDRVAMQKDAFASNLFWHVDLESALSEAKASDKPVLSLRLLGRLDEEYSCANSRFFRSVLYSNSEISGYLRSNYVLHWESVRPAPKITIEFGDGRKLIRTITGNSIHYMLDQNGNLIDALPGLYSPRVFRDYLIRIKDAANTDPDFRRVYWRSRRNALLAKWSEGLELTADGPRVITNSLRSPAGSAEKGEDPNAQPPTALEAAPLAVTKALVEMPTVKSISYDSESLRKSTDFEGWRILAGLSAEAVIDAGSRNFIRLKTNRSGQMSEPAFSRLISNLEEFISIDTVQNEYLFHSTIYEWLETDPTLDLGLFNDRVYEELFLTPRSDKWFGLYSSDVYSAIEDNGVIN